MIGQHLSLTSVNTVVKPALSVFANRRNPIQERRVAILSAAS